MSSKTKLDPDKPGRVDAAGIRRAHPATAIAVLALFLALGGAGAYAAGKIGAGDIARKAIHARHIARKAIHAGHIARNAIHSRHIGRGQVRSSDVRDGSLTSRDIHPGTLTAAVLSPAARQSLRGPRGQKGERGPAGPTAQTEPFHEVDSPGEPQFNPGWSNYTGLNGDSTTAAFYKDPLGVVHLKGTVERSGPANVAFTLPAGYRPAQVVSLPTTVFDGTVGGGAGRIQINTDGAVLTGDARQAPMLLDGMTFRAAP